VRSSSEARRAGNVASPGDASNALPRRRRRRRRTARARHQRLRAFLRRARWRGMASSTSAVRSSPGGPITRSGPQHGGRHVSSHSSPRRRAVRCRSRCSRSVVLSWPRCRPSSRSCSAVCGLVDDRPGLRSGALEQLRRSAANRFRLRLASSRLGSIADLSARRHRLFSTQRELATASVRTKPISSKRREAERKMFPQSWSLFLYTEHEEDHEDEVMKYMPPPDRR